MSKNDVEPSVLLPRGQTPPPRWEAFTLVELLVVVAIIAALLAILLPTLRQARRQAEQAVCLSNLRQVGLGFGFYRADFGDIYPAAQDPLSDAPGPYYWLWMGRGFRALVGPYIVDDIDANNPSVLYCPADRTELYERTSYAYSMAFYHNPAQINRMTTTDWTYSRARAADDLKEPTGQSSEDVRWPASKVLIGDWGSYHDPVANDNGWWDDVGLGCYLLADGHGEPLRAKEIRPANDGKPHPNLTVDGVRGRDVD